MVNAIYYLKNDCNFSVIFFNFTFFKIFKFKKKSKSGRVKMTPKKNMSNIKIGKSLKMFIDLKRNVMSGGLGADTNNFDY